CRAGASGYVAGRSVWRDAVGGGPEAMALVRERLEQLNRITRECGRPYVAGTGLDEALAELGPTWYETWHAAA
ncbi:MAG: hypothetical protein LBM66_00985, partial [Bifidobacteriaceae bacterium]|nr:hypothetical protein [Bifidobacteriaceae bacterium]